MTRARVTDVAARIARVVRRMSGMSKQDAAIIMDYYRDGLEPTRRLVPEVCDAHFFNKIDCAELMIKRFCGACNGGLGRQSR